MHVIVCVDSRHVCERSLGGLQPRKCSAKAEVSRATPRGTDVVPTDYPGTLTFLGDSDSHLDMYLSYFHNVLRKELRHKLDVESCRRLSKPLCESFVRLEACRRLQEFLPHNPTTSSGPHQQA